MPEADPEKAARRIVEIASTVEPVQDGRIHVELINGPFLFKDKGSPAEYGAGMALAIERGWRNAAKIPALQEQEPPSTRSAAGHLPVEG